MASMDSYFRIGLHVLGANTRREKNKWIQRLGYFNTFSMMLSLISFGLYCFRDIPVHLKVVAMQTFFTTYHSIPKFYRAIFENDFLVDIFEQSDSLWDLSYKQNFNLASTKRQFVTRRTGQFFRTFAFMTGFIVIAGYGYSISSKLFSDSINLPYQYELWLDEEKYFWVVLFLGLFLASFVTHGLVVMPTLFFMQTLEIIQHLKILKSLIILPNADLRKCVHYHAEIIRYNDKINEYWGTLLINEILASPMQVGAGTLAAQFALQHNDPSGLGHFCRFMFVIGLSFNICFNPQRISNEILRGTYTWVTALQTFDVTVS